MKLPSPNRSERMRSLISYLETVPNGIITEPETLAGLLEACWEELAGSGEEAMTGAKLGRGMEDVRWNRPCLTFDIERHGPTCCGSTYADVQEWRVDLSDMSAAMIDSRRRQVRKPEPKFDTKKPAAKLALAIRKHRNSRRLQWNPDGSVKVLIKKIIPQHTCDQTIETRSLRFKEQLASLLAPHGWELSHRLRSARCELRLKSPTANPPD